MTAPRRLSHYELHERIGGDADTEVYRARDLRLDRDVALRLLRAEPATRASAVERFRLEARYASIVSHPHIFAIHDSGEEGGHPFVVCELLQGQLLAAAPGGMPLPLPLAIEYGIQLADALAAAHRRGLYHGDVRPSHVFLTTDGHLKLLGLGAAAAGRAHPQEAADPSRTTAVDVTAAAQQLDIHPYRAPEQIAGDQLHRDKRLPVVLPQLVNRAYVGVMERRRGRPGHGRCVYFVVDSAVPHLLRILIVDDNVDGADMLATMLSMWGYETAMEHSGPAALEQARAFRPHVILLDIALPGMDGYEVARQVRLLPGLEQVSVVALTGYARDPDRQPATDRGFAAHLVKPVDLDTLRRTLAALEPR